VFGLPKKFEYQPHRGDEISQVSAQKPVQDDLVLRYQQLHNRLDKLKMENEEAGAEATLLVSQLQKYACCL